MGSKTTQAQSQEAGHQHYILQIGKNPDLSPNPANEEHFQEKT